MTLNGVILRYFSHYFTLFCRIRQFLFQEERAGKICCIINNSAADFYVIFPRRQL